MLEAEKLSQLIGDIYDAALDATLWVAVLGKIRGYVIGAAVGLYWKDAASRNGAVHYQDGGIDPQYVQSYFEHYSKLDPTSTGVFFAKLEEPTATADHLPYDEFVATRFYREWVQPQGMVDCANVVLDKSLTTYTVFSVFRHQRDGLMDEGMRERMRLIAPHMRRAALIGRVIDTKTAEAATFADTLDGLSAGMLLVDSGGRIVHANASGHVMLATGDFLRAAGGCLVASDPLSDLTLREVFAAAGSGDAAIGIKGIAVPLTARAGERYVAHVLPLTSGARRRAGTNYAAVAALFVHKAALETPSPPEVIARTFGLTPSELRVLLGIVEVGGAPETAEALGIAEGTVKTHLRRLFAKTGTTRQADLVKLVASYANPLVG